MRKPGESKGYWISLGGYRSSKIAASQQYFNNDYFQHEGSYRLLAMQAKYRLI